MVINMITKKKDYTRQMLNLIRESKSNNKPSLLIEEENKTDKKNGSYKILASNPHFGDVRTSQEEEIRKAISEPVEMNDDSLLFFPKEDSNGQNNIILTAKIVSLNLTFEFRYVDSTTDGVYIWTNGLPLTEANTRVIGKIRDAFDNWKQSITTNGDLLSKLEQEFKREKDED